MQQNKEKEVITYSKQIMHFFEELVAGANHEINNLLFIIEMSSELIETSNNQKEKMNAIQNIENQTKKISQILMDLRSVVKDCGTEEVKLTKVSDVSGQVIELCKTRFNNHKIIFRNNVPDDILIEGRETQLTQAILAILNSSHDAIIEGHSKSKWIDFDVQTQGNSLNIIISDSGNKISPENSKKIFSPSFDAEGRKGLPLIIAKNIIESHGGSISFDKDNEVNAFIIKFPHFLKAESSAQVAVAEKKCHLKVA